MARSRGWLTLSLVGAALVGCEPPEQILPTTPPGIEPPKILPATEGQGAQAIGESANYNKAGGEPPKPTAADIPPAEPTAKGEVKETKTGVKYETLKEGTGPGAKPGQNVTVHYTGTLADGKKFDSSRDRGEPFSFPLGFNRVILGWDYGVTGMKVGERRRLVIPPHLAYGVADKPGIPGNSTLTFDVELLELK